MWYTSCLILNGSAMLAKIMLATQSLGGRDPPKAPTVLEEACIGDEASC